MQHPQASRPPLLPYLPHGPRPRRPGLRACCREVGQVTTHHHQVALHVKSVLDNLDMAEIGG